MNVTLMSYTPDALNLLLRTKGTRLAHTDDPATWDDAKRQEHLDYMRDTIKSSWEFVDYVFKIEGVTRAFTHQLVRTRTGSYAQESQRTVDVSDHKVIRPEFPNQAALEAWDQAELMVMDQYAEMIKDYDMPIQDARGILPTNISTSIIAKFNLRTLHETAKLRLCTRTQGEYQDVFRAMRALVVGVHPWAGEFLDVYCAAQGTCAFPRYGATSCPLYAHVVPQERVLEVRAAIRAAEATTRHVAVPVAKDGRTM
jgi:flavin-dependent thymidylate synthase